ncbi:MAG: rod shape-determining protein MreC [Desulfamplus sp.]|nr:rod shape-determining protein MreC [Desulfamplus sp.]
MFSRKTAFLIGFVLFIATSFTILTLSSRNAMPENGIEGIAISFISPFQMIVSTSFTWCTDIWQVYFATVSAGEENRRLKRQLANTMALQNQCRELELENIRLRRFIDFSNASEESLIAAKVIGRDPSPWFQALMINKGLADGLLKGLPVLVSEGVVGQIVEVSEKFSRVLLITDRNSAVDALVQSSRARGIVQGNNTDQCLFKYVLRKDNISPGDIIISSGLDQVFPKGLRIGEVFDIKKDNSDLFQMIFIKTFVDFDKLEEVLVSKKVDILVSNNEVYIPEKDKEILSGESDIIPVKSKPLSAKRNIDAGDSGSNSTQIQPSSSQPSNSSLQSDNSSVNSATGSVKPVKKSLKNASSRMVKLPRKEE